MLFLASTVYRLLICALRSDGLQAYEADITDLLDEGTSTSTLFWTVLSVSRVISQLSLSLSLPPPPLTGAGVLSQPHACWMLIGACDPML